MLLFISHIFRDELRNYIIILLQNVVIFLFLVVTINDFTQTIVEMTGIVLVITLLLKFTERIMDDSPLNIVYFRVRIGLILLTWFSVEDAAILGLVFLRIDIFTERMHVNFLLSM